MCLSGEEWQFEGRRASDKFVHTNIGARNSGLIRKRGRHMFAP